MTLSYFGVEIRQHGDVYYGFYFFCFFSFNVKILRLLLCIFFCITDLLKMLTRPPFSRKNRSLLIITSAEQCWHWLPVQCFWRMRQVLRTLKCSRTNTRSLQWRVILPREVSTQCRYSFGIVVSTPFRHFIRHGQNTRIFRILTVSLFQF